MNNRLAIIPGTSKARPATARLHLVAVLAQKILDNPATKDFLVASERQLCRRFGIGLKSNPEEFP
jgi:hypothetical protein